MSLTRRLEDVVHIGGSYTFSCNECGDPLKAHLDERRDEIVVEFCQSCRDYAHNQGWDEGLAKGKESQG